MTRELKLALIVGFALVLVVTVLISDHLSRARHAQLAGNIPAEPIKIVEPATLTAEPVATDLAQTPTTTPSTRPDDIAGPNLAGVATNNPKPIDVTGPVTPEPFTLTQGKSSIAPVGSTPAPIDTGDHDLARTIADHGGTLKGGVIVLPPVVRTDNVPINDPIKLTQPNPTSVSPAPIVPAIPDRIHTVVSGDSFFKICQQYYSDGKVWRKLVKYNKLDEASQLKIGQQIKVPTSEVLLGKKAPATIAATLPTPTGPLSNRSSIAGLKPSLVAQPLPVTPVATKTHSYTIKKGDTLAQIAQHELGSAKRAHEIADLNKHTIKDPDTLPLGATITLPAA